MAAKNKAAQARQAAEGAWEQPLRAARGRGPRAARERARGARERAQRLRPPDERQARLEGRRGRQAVPEGRQAGLAESLRDASDALREGPKKRKRRFGLGRLLLLTIVGGGIALALSEPLRKKVLDALFGAEEEFDYQSTTTSPPPPPPPAASDASPAESPTSTG